MSKMNIDQSLDDIMLNNVTKFSGMRKTRDGRVVMDRRGGFGGRRNNNNFRRDGKQRNYNNFNNRGGGRQYNNYDDNNRDYNNRGGNEYGGRGNRYTQARRAFRYRDQRDTMSSGDGIKLITNGHITKMHICNLDFGVSQGDMKELFSSIGRLKHVALHYDKNGRSQGTCEIIFERKSDALKAFNQYNGVPLDGRPMTLELMGEPMRNQRDEQRQPERRRDSYGGRNNDDSFRRERPARQERRDVNAEDLDKELDAYLSNKTPKAPKPESTSK